MRVCLLIAWPIAPNLQQGIAAGEHPNMEVFDLAAKLRGEVIDPNAAIQSRSVLVRIGRFFGTPLGLALFAWQRRNDFDLVYVGSEKIGILTLNHYLSNPKKAFLFRCLRLQNSIDALYLS